MRMHRLLAVVVPALVASAVVIPAADAAPSTLTFGASADTFVNSNSATTAFGTQNTARAAGKPVKISLFKFNVAGVPSGSSVSSAQLTLTGTGTQPADTLDVYAVDNSWTEATTYNTKPALGAKVASVAMPANGGKVTASVPVTGNGAVSFAVTKANTATADNILNTREATSGTPQLAVSYDGVVAPPVQTNLYPEAPGLDGNQNVKAGDAVHFNGNWHVTDAASPGAEMIDWYVDNVYVAQANYSAQPVGAYGSLSTEAWTATEGQHTLTMVMDYFNTVPESNESDNVSNTTFTVAPAAPKDQPLAAANTVASAAGFTNCDASTQTQVTPFAPGTTSNNQWKVASPPNNTTYNLNGYTNTAYPASVSPLALGTTTAPSKLCVLNGTVAGTTDDAQGWTYYHDTYNASCERMVGTDELQVRNLRCHDIEDGLKFLETNGTGTNLNTTKFFSSGTYLSRVRDDCIENDYTLGGYLYDSLWDGCNSGVSERPSSSNGTWTSPANETITLDHMNIGLWQTWHEADGKSGENALFKWSSSANKLVIKCSVFKVDSVSLNGASSNDIPAGTVIDDSACPNHPTTIVWLGGGAYPGNLQGLPITVTSDVNVWNTAVSNWKAAHGF